MKQVGTLHCNFHSPHQVKLYNVVMYSNVMSDPLRSTRRDQRVSIFCGESIVILVDYLDSSS